MASTFINPRINPETQLGVSSFEDAAPVYLCPGSLISEIEVVIRAVYRQVLGNVHVMENERLTTAESQLKQGSISVREFVRQVAQSELYRALFFETCSRIRSIELNFKHLLGRAPGDHEEMVFHGQVLDQHGWSAEIDTYIDSDEYLEAFGEDIVPYYRGYKTQAGQKMVGFTHLFQLLRGAASSDKALTSQGHALLESALMANRPSRIAPVKGATSPWQRPQVTATVSYKSRYQSWAKASPPRVVRSHNQWVSPAPNQASALDRQAQFYQAYQPFKETAPIELPLSSSDAEVEVVIRASYRQVFGNAHVMESERLLGAESQLKSGTLSVREFIRQLAKSPLYRSRFFDSCYRYRAIELNYKHLLGRAPDNFEEMRYHSTVLDEQGFAADIDTYLDSDEYQHAFGELVVPYYRGYRTHPGQSLLELTNLFQLLRSASSSDKAMAGGNQPQLTRALIRNSPYGKLKVRDASEILAEVFKPKLPSTVETQAQQKASVSLAAEQALQKTHQQQAEIIATLRAQLSDLGPAATIGATYLSNDWKPLAADNADKVATASSPLQQQIEAQAAEIAKLETSLADARRYAMVGDARLNRWRRRAFRG